MVKKKFRELSLAKRILFYVIFLFICLILLEIASAIIGYFVISQSQKDHLVKLKQNKESYFIPHPYTLYMPKPGFSAYGKKQHNALGFRGNEIDPSADKFRIFCLGGSTTYGWLEHDPEKTYPMQMKIALSGERQDLEVINAGLPMGASPEILSTFQYRVLPLKPKMLVLHLGLNDIFPTLMPGYKSDYSHDRENWVESQPGFIRRNSFLLNSNLVKLIYLISAGASGEVNKQVEFVKPEHAEWTKFCVDGDADDPDRYAGFRNNLKSLLGICQTNNIKVVLTPTNVREADLKHYKALHKAYLQNIKIMKELAAEFDNVYFFDSRKIGIPQRCFQDICHLNREGMALKGFAFAQFIKDNNLMDKD